MIILTLIKCIGSGLATSSLRFTMIFNYFVFYQRLGCEMENGDRLAAALLQIFHFLAPFVPGAKIIIIILEQKFISCLIISMIFLTLSDVLTLAKQLLLSLVQTNLSGLVVTRRNRRLSVQIGRGGRFSSRGQRIPESENVVGNVITIVFVKVGCHGQVMEIVLENVRKALVAEDLAEHPFVKLWGMEQIQVSGESLDVGDPKLVLSVFEIFQQTVLVFVYV